MSAYLSEPGVICSLGEGEAAVREALFAPAVSGVRESDFFSAERLLHLGRVTSLSPGGDGNPGPAYRSRNNALLWAAVAQLRPRIDDAIARFGPSRVGVVLGTSTSGIAETEHAVRDRQGDVFPSTYHYAQQELGSPARFLATALKLTGPTAVISTACSSSAKALASAARWLEAGLVDAVITGGADTLCRFTIAGFMALDSVSAERCNPMSRNRKGINIGEAAAIFLMTRDGGPVRLAGWGETSDAHHISAPEPTGRRAADTMRLALERAQLAPADIGYVNMHGTATQQNDAMESRGLEAVLGLGVPVSSTKPLTGHTLGAAGALEAVLSWLALTDEAGRLPPHWYDGERDPELPAITLVAPGQRGRPRAVLSNSFAFGGSNACLALVRS